MVKDSSPRRREHSKAANLERHCYWVAGRGGVVSAGRVGGRWRGWKRVEFYRRLRVLTLFTFVYLFHIIQLFTT